MNPTATLLAVIAIFTLGVFYFFTTLDSSNQAAVQNSLNTSGDELSMQMKEKQFSRVPELAGISSYLNTGGKAFKISDFKGKVVLVDFWTYTCINCIRTLPHLVDWHEKYSDKGLVIIGVHTPEFEFEKEKSNVEFALEKYGIKYPVVQDNDYLTWRAFNNQYWPNKFLVDRDGFIRYNHIGEGAYEETEAQIQLLLKEISPSVTFDSSSPVVPDATPKAVRTPELYAGYQFALPRGQNIGNADGLQPEQTVEYFLPSSLAPNIIYLSGKWTSNADSLQAAPEPESILTLHFSAGSLNVVLENPASPIEVDVKIDGEYVLPTEAGKDLQFDGERSFLKVTEAQLYNVFDSSPSSHKIEFSIHSSEFKISAFTFGD